MELSFIPSNAFYEVYWYSVVFVVLFLSLLFAFKNNFSYLSLNRFSNGVLVCLAIVCIVLIGGRPIDKLFVDTVTYAGMYDSLSRGNTLAVGHDQYFFLVMKFFSKYVNVHVFFLFCAVLYVVPLVYACRNLFSYQWGVALLMLMSSLFFWAYGVNTIRAGIASSFALFAFSQPKRPLHKWGAIIISVLSHFSFILPILAFLFSKKFSKLNLVLVLWLLSIVVSLTMPSIVTSILGGMSFDNRLSYLTAQVDRTLFSRVGFRWDFLLYSTMPIAWGYYLIRYRNYRDKFFFSILQTYLIANIFWVLVIRANFSDRFAFLSWFLMPIILVYPLLSTELGCANRGSWIASMLLFFSGVTTILSFI